MLSYYTYCTYFNFFTNWITKTKTQSTFKLLIKLLNSYVQNLKCLQQCSLIVLSNTLYHINFEYLCIIVFCYNTI